MFSTGGFFFLSDSHSTRQITSSSALMSAGLQLGGGFFFYIFYEVTGARSHPPKRGCFQSWGDVSSSPVFSTSQLCFLGLCSPSLSLKFLICKMEHWGGSSKGRNIQSLACHRCSANDHGYFWLFSQLKFPERERERAQHQGK